jgi:glycosyltransferase involved in cell wall biosynthesis
MAKNTTANTPDLPVLSLFDCYDLISKSDLFSSEYYLAQYEDISQAGVDPLIHYLEAGASERRDPHPNFDTQYYLEQCIQLGLEPTNPLLHYLQVGRTHGLKIQRGAEEEFVRPSSETETQQWIANRVLQSGLFEFDFYKQQCGVNFTDEREALLHFFDIGYKEGKRPNLYFDPTWYLSHYSDIRDAAIEPLFHFLVQGDSEGRRPSLIFDNAWYRTAYNIPSDLNTLAHYLEHRRGCRFSPIPDFDADFYGDVNKDVRSAGVDPFEHFLFTGFREGRNPSAKFNIKYYVKRYLGGVLEQNPLIHFLQHKHEPGVFSAPPEDEASVPRAVKQFSKRAAEFEAFKPLPQSASRKAKILAYYLPQFHAFPENDEWWGKGFTEWTNIARGVSRYKGHFQPRIPRDLGFYSLEDALPTLRRQVEMAKGGGLYGFVFYYYWFNGKRLMEGPVEQLLTDRTIDMPFALMWANENWTRRWDGDEHEVLISQDYDSDDDERLMGDLVRHFEDPRYIRVKGRPLLMIYRPGIIPSAKEVIGRWREVFKNKFGEDPILVMAQAFNDTDPAVYGFDGAIEFPPHKLTANMPSINDNLEYLDVEFNGKVFSYDDVVARSLNEPAPSFPLIKTVVPSWDNDARRQGTGLVLDGSTPAKYESWLRQLIDHARRQTFFGEPFVCVNAWNEWCEAAYLEPDLHYGSAYLNATGRAVAGISAAGPNAKLLLVGHDAFPSGAQHLLLNIGRRLIAEHGIHIEYLLLSGGALLPAYQEIAPVTLADDSGVLAETLESAAKRGYVNAIVNTVASAHILPTMKQYGIDGIALVHELPRIVREKHLHAGARMAFEASRNAVFASSVVRDQLAAELKIIPDDRNVIIPQGMYKQLEYSADSVAALRKEFGIRKGEKLVLGVGYADLRKGFDLFLQLWRQLSKSPGPRTHFCWVGEMDPGLREWLTPEIEAAKGAGTFHMPGYRQRVAPYLFAADAFALVSREDPFPTVVHEALSVGMPVFAFADSGGMSGFLVDNGMGVVVPHADVIAMASEIATAFKQPLDETQVDRRKAFVRTELDFSIYVNKLLKLALPNLPTVSVAVPNYNYAQFMPERLSSIFQQNHPVHEILVLDDCSKDDSLAVIPRIAEEWGRKIYLQPNKVNSGSVFAQWRKAAETATGEFLWIAEADDLSEPGFLSAVVLAMQDDPRICLGFSDSRSINYDGSPLWENYKGYYAQQEPGALSESATWSGEEFVRRFLAVRNLILNVSAVVWRRKALLDALDNCQSELRDFRMAGDWRLYLEALVQKDAKIAYIASPLNVHRRHAESVTHALKAELHIAEIAACQELAAFKLKLDQRSQTEQSKYLSEVSAQLLRKSTNESVSVAGKYKRANARRGQNKIG